MANIFVIGSINQDVVVSLARTPRPGETVVGERLSYYQGGKGANQARASARSGATTCFQGKVGNDAFGASLKAEMKEHRLRCEILTDRAEPTGTALILVDSDGQNSIAVVLGANASLQADECSSLNSLSAGDIVLLQNELSDATNFQIQRVAQQNGATIMLNAAPGRFMSQEQLKEVSLLIVNEHELRVTFGQKGTASGSPQEVLAEVKKKAVHTRRGIILTLGSKGVVAVIDGEEYVVSGHNVRAVDTTGAGDCFCGAFAASLANGEEIPEALEFANAAAALSVQRHGAGASFPEEHEVKEVLGS